MYTINIVSFLCKLIIFKAIINSFYYFFIFHLKVFVNKKSILLENCNVLLYLLRLILNKYFIIIILLLLLLYNHNKILNTLYNRCKT